MGTEKTPPLEDEPDVKSRLSGLLQNEAMSDVTFLVDEPTRSFPCHKLILALGSKVFEAMFFGRMAEMGDVRAPDITQTGFAIMLRYLYTDAVVINSESEAFEAAYAAKKYLIRTLFRECENHLMSSTTLTPQTVFPLHEKAAFLEMRLFRARCLRYVSRHARKVLRSGHLAQASKATVRDVLGLDLMDIDSELDLIEAVWGWGHEECRRLDLDCSEANVRKVTRDFVRHLRFLSVRKGDLQETLDRFRLLDTSDQLTVLWCMAMSSPADGAKMPANFSKVSRTRSVSNCSRIELPSEYVHDCTLSSFGLVDHRATAEVVVTGPPIVLVGAVLAYRPIPCYSLDHRTLGVRLGVLNSSTRSRSGAKTSVRAGHEATSQQQLEHEVLLDDYVALSEGERVTVTVDVTGEGVRVMQCPKVFTCSCGSSEVTFCFESGDAERVMLPFKELMCTALELDSGGF